MKVEGRLLYGVETFLQNGAVAAFIVDGDTISLLLSDDGWKLTQGQAADIVIDVDGHKYQGHGAAPQANMIVAPNVTLEFVKAFVEGDTAVLDIGGGVTWTLNLDGFTASFKEALHAVGGAI